MQVQKDNKIGEVVAANFHAAKVFEDYGLDFCCGGKKSISAACKEKGVASDLVLKDLESLNGTKDTNVHFDKWELDFLIEYIVNNHHSYVLNTVSTIQHHFDKVVSKHGPDHPELAAMQNLFNDLANELLSHMQKEERMLFPYVKKMIFTVRNNMELQFPPFGSIGSPVKVMEAEHEKAGELTGLINKLSNNFAIPEGACTTYRVLLNELKEFESDLHLHIHLENNILFPKAIAMEESILSRIYKID